MRPAVPLAVGGALLALACTEIMTEPGVPVAIELAPLPMPAIVAGDSLRDSTGVAVPLLVRVYDGRGALIEDPPVSFVRLGGDPAIELDPATGFAVGLQEGDARVVAQTAGLQSAALMVPVTPRPDTLIALNDLQDTLDFIGFQDHLHELRVQLMSDTGADELAPVRRYLVNFSIAEPEGLPVDDSTFVLLVNDQSRPSRRDTTATTGTASRFLRLSPWVQQPPPDSVVVEVTARHADGSHVAGSPVRYVISVEPVLPP